MSVVFLSITIVLCGLAIGLVAGLVGIGGGSLVIPLLNLGFGLDILTATSTSLFTTLPTSLSGAIGHIRNHTSNLKIALLLGIAGACCSPLGAIVAGHTPTVLLTLITAVILTIPTVQMVSSAHKQRKTGASDKAADITWSGTHLDARTVAICIPTGAVAGFCSGLVGLGGGFVVIPVLAGILKRGMHEVAGTSVAFIVISCLPGIITHAIAGDISWLHGLLVAAGSIPGALLGARLSKRLDGLYLKYVLAVVLVCVVVALVVKGVL